MANRLQTVAYAFPVLASMTNNTLTNMTQITVTLPETTKTFRSVWVEVAMDDIVTATGGTVTTSTVELRLGSAAYTSTTNANAKANTGENISWRFDRDFTSHFTTNWSGTSMTCDLRMQVNQSTGTTLNMVNVTAILYITYEFDDTDTTQLKSVWIPLNGPTSNIPLTKTSLDTIPALDTYLPESSKSYKSIFIVTQANTNMNIATDHTVSYELSSLGVHTTGNYEAALLTDRWTRYVWDITTYITTNTTHTFNVWYPSGANGRMHNMQAWMVVTYTYDESASTRIMNSLMPTMEIDSPMGGTSSADFQRATRELWVQETNPTFTRLAFFMTWQAAANEAGLNARIGTGSFVPYTNVGAGVVAGNKGLMIRNDSPTGISLGRGRNTLSVDVYNTSTTQVGGNVGGFWIINYTSDKHSSGSRAHNHTVLWAMYTQPTSAAVQKYVTSAVAPIIPETNYFVTALGLGMNAMMGISIQGISIKVERLASGEGGLIFERAYADVSLHDVELGVYDTWAQIRSLFNRWTGDADTSRLALETSRRWIAQTSTGVWWMNSLVMGITYHSITYTAADSITGFTGTVDIALHRSATGEMVLETTRSGDGAYSFTWYDNTEYLYTVATDGTNVGRSEDTLAV